MSADELQALRVLLPGLSDALILRLVEAAPDDDAEEAVVDVTDRIPLSRSSSWCPLTMGE